jgi:hypothetical protein
MLLSTKDAKHILGGGGYEPHFLIIHVLEGYLNVAFNKISAVLWERALEPYRLYIDLRVT